MNPPFLSIGIDLGTTYCCVAVLRNEEMKPEVIPNDVGKNTTPSYVCYAISDEDEAEEDIYAGQTAKDLAYENTETTVFDVKRLIGRSFHDPRIQRYKQLWPFQLVNCNGMVGVQIREKVLLPQIIVKELIAHLLQYTENYLRCSIHSVVITIPAYFNELQRGLTRESFETAGIKNIEFISEPTAAAYAFGLQSSKGINNKPRTCLTFDLGGGTFDLTVFKLSPDKSIEIQGIGGDPQLGGEDFDDLLTEYCITKFKEENGIDLLAGKSSEDDITRIKTAIKLRRIRRECEKQKCYLSSATNVVISLDGLHGDKVMAVPVTRKIFNDLIKEHLDRSIKTLDTFLTKNGFTKRDIDDVVLIGGSTRIPKVQEIVRDYFGGKALHTSVDADEAVACGAAIHAFNTMHPNRTSKVPLINKVDILTSYSFVDEEINSPAKVLSKELEGNKGSKEEMRNSKDLDILLRNFSEIRIGQGSVLGFLTVSGPAFPVICTRSDQGILHAVIAASFFGKGKIVACSHDCLMIPAEPAKEFAGRHQFILNSIEWASGKSMSHLSSLSRESNTVGIVVCSELYNGQVISASIQKFLKQHEISSRICEFQKTSFEQLLQFRVVMLFTNYFEESNVKPMKKYIENGGGLIFAVTSWAHHYFLKTRSDFEKKYPPNMLSSMAGIIWHNKCLSGPYQGSQVISASREHLRNYMKKS